MSTPVALSQSRLDETASTPQHFLMSAAPLDVSHVLQEALSLPLSERSYIAEHLLKSLDDDQELSPAWSKELEDRVQRRQSGETRTYSHEEVHSRIEAILA